MEKTIINKIEKIRKQALVKAIRIEELKEERDKQYKFFTTQFDKYLDGDTEDMTITYMNHWEAKHNETVEELKQTFTEYKHLMDKLSILAELLEGEAGE